MSLANDIHALIAAERETRFASLGLPPEFVGPNYGGRSIVNVPASIVRLFGGEMSTPPLDAPLVERFAPGVKRVVLILVDALGYRELLRALERNSQNGFHRLLRDDATLTPLTSVFPSTTTAALTALWSGYTPAEHGFMGYQMFLREFAVRADMIAFSPTATERISNAELLAAGLKPDSFLAVPSLPQTLMQWEVPTYNLIELPYTRSALSRVQIRGQREMKGVVTSSDLWGMLRAMVEQHRHERALFVAYWSKIDTISHVYGPSPEFVLDEIDSFAYSFEHAFLKRLSPQALEGTLFLLTADHGHVDTPIAHTTYLRDHPTVRERLVMDPAGEPRAAYLYVRQGQTDAVREYFAAHLSEKFAVLDSQAALDGGLFGHGVIAPEARYRIGDLLVLSRGSDILWERHEAPHTLGRHGGLTPPEMLVPLIAARLDA